MKRGDRQERAGGEAQKSKRRSRAPEERSSKIPPSRVGIGTKCNAQKPKRRDPRFDRSSGQFNQGLFERSYGFVNNYEEEELASIDRQIKKVKNLEIAESLKSKARSLRDCIRSRKSKEKRNEIIREWKRSERVLVKQGKAPFYLKKSDLKNIELVDKYKELSKKGSSAIRKYIEKRNKKRASRTKKRMPQVASSSPPFGYQ